MKQFLRYMAALLAPDVAGLDSVVTPDSRFHELEAMGLPRGIEGLKLFRRQVNAAIPDELILSLRCALKETTSSRPIW